MNARVAVQAWLAAETDIPYQTLINLYLVDCAKSGRTIDLSWRDQGGEGHLEPPPSPGP